MKQVWTDYEHNRKHWTETVPGWRLALYCAVAYIALCVVMAL